MKLRWQIFNWLTAGRVVIDQKSTQVNGPENIKENVMSVGQIASGYGVVSLSDSIHGSNHVVPDMTIRVTNAIGGYIVNIDHYNPNKSMVSEKQYYIIPEDRDFNVELGKIITLSRLKS